jgi:REP element-mobilizing transposase RayT
MVLCFCGAGNCGDDGGGFAAWGRELHRYQLHSFVVMPNHVHLLVTPHVLAGKWLGPAQRIHCHQANLLLGTHGPFWQEESFDRLVRSDAAV